MQKLRPQTSEQSSFLKRQRPGVGPESYPHLALRGGGPRLPESLSCFGPSGTAEFPWEGLAYREGLGNGFYHQLSTEHYRQQIFVNSFVKINPTIIINRIKNAL